MKNGKIPFLGANKRLDSDHSQDGAGKFQVLINDVPTGTVFGSDQIKQWHWVYGGEVAIREREVKLSLQDLTGFDGRCDVVVFPKRKPYCPMT